MIFSLDIGDDFWWKDFFCIERSPGNYVHDEKGDRRNRDQNWYSQ